MNSPDLASWLLNQGQYYPFKHDPHPPGIRPGKLEHCYREAMANAIKCPALTYCEGYCWVEGYSPDDTRPGHGQETPVPHGFCINKEGRVVDTVWARFKKSDKQYFGVPFKTDFVKKFVNRPEPKSDLAILLWREADWPIQNNRILENEWKHPSYRNPNSVHPVSLGTS